MRTIAFIRMLFIAFAVVGVSGTTAVADEAPAQTLFTNVNVFDGVNDGLLENANVLVEGNLIKTVSTAAISAGGATVINGEGRTLMPGLMDMHTHLSIVRELSTARHELSPLAHGAIAMKRAEGMLMNGFTTVMDVGGPAIYLKDLIDGDAGFFGPRIYSAEAFITQTNGHGDFRTRMEYNPNNSGGIRSWYEYYTACIADGVTEIRRCGRENFRKGATHLKMMVGGGVSSRFDPLHGLQGSPEEIAAAVEVARNMKTFVTVHAYTDESVRMAVEAGVPHILHAPLITEDTAKLMGEKGVYMQPNLEAVLGLTEENAAAFLSPASFAKWKSIYDEYPVAMEAAIKHGVKIVFGTDLLSQWNQTLAFDKTAALELLQLEKYLGAAGALRAATSTAAEVIDLMGPNDPYQEGAKGVVAEGAYADLLLVDGNVLEDLALLTDPGKNLVVIMKDGVIYKNTLN
ncbi:metal-dependent hydrolase family protein [Ruegeria atlantica]|uniref:D-glutamate deacylase n=1 Tax=Ruegeria atlantica TaxID=81569 RepID=A0A0P1ELQ3_9RHOB|nr:amidohydrolase family protein [Ruegeria atlantica]CUH42045.1 D-glutamate deacylase [Ruegeria atlantica]